jgi:hypothetical protein
MDVKISSLFIFMLVIFALLHPDPQTIADPEPTSTESIRFQADTE